MSSKANLDTHAKDVSVSQISGTGVISKQPMSRTAVISTQPIVHEVFQEGLSFLVDATNFFVTVDLEWVYVLESLDSQSSILHGHRTYGSPQSFFEQFACYFLGKHMGNFEVEIVDMRSYPMLIIERPLSKSYWCGWCCCCGEFGNRIMVSFGDGTPLGSVVQVCGFPTVHFVVKDITGRTVIIIYPPCFGSANGCRPNVYFKVKFVDNEALQRGPKGKPATGSIKKTYSGCFYEVFTDSRNYSFNFPLDLPLQLKALLLSSVFLLHPIYFERG